MSTAIAEPVSAINTRYRMIQSRYATGSPDRALDIITNYDHGERYYKSYVRAVTLYPGGGEGYTHPNEAESAGHAFYRSQNVGRYSQKAHEKAAGLALLAYAPQLARMIEWAETR